jgi:hypothetical protein
VRNLTELNCIKGGSSPQGIRVKSKEDLTPMTKTNPLERYAKTAPSRVMREIAAVAVKQHFTQASLARALPCSEPAVIKHFSRTSPVKDTVALYSKTLHLEAEYIGLVSEPPIALSAARNRVWFKRLVEHLRLAEKRVQVFKPGTADDAVKHFRALNESEQEQMLEAYALAQYRWRAGLAKNVQPAYGGLQGLETFAQAFNRYYDLDSRVWKTKPGESYLLIAWLNLISGPLTVHDVEIVLGVIETLAKRRGANVDAMRQYLEASEFYETRTEQAKEDET